MRLFGEHCAVFCTNRAAPAAVLSDAGLTGVPRTFYLGLSDFVRTFVFDADLLALYLSVMAGLAFLLPEQSL